MRSAREQVAAEVDAALSLAIDELAAGRTLAREALALPEQQERDAATPQALEKLQSARRMLGAAIQRLTPRTVDPLASARAWLEAERPESDALMAKLTKRARAQIQRIVNAQQREDCGDD